MARYRINPRGSHRGHFGHYTVERATEYKAFGFWPTYKWNVVDIFDTHSEALEFLRSLIRGTK